MGKPNEKGKERERQKGCEGTKSIGEGKNRQGDRNRNLLSDKELSICSVATVGS